MKSNIPNSKLVSDDYLKDYFANSKTNDQSFEEFRKKLQSVSHPRVHKHPQQQPKRKCTDQFFALSKECFQANLLFEQVDKYNFLPGSGKKINSEREKKSEKNFEEGGRSFRFYNGNVKLISDILKQNGFQQHYTLTNLSSSSNIGSNFSDFIWCCSHLKSNLFGCLPDCQKINIFPHSYECTRKDALARNINRLIQVFGSKHFAFMPECYIWPKEKDELRRAIQNSKPVSVLSRSSSSSSFSSFQGNGINETPVAAGNGSLGAKALQKRIFANQRIPDDDPSFPIPYPSPQLPSNVITAPWIVKPANSSQGKGIFIVSNFYDIEKNLFKLSPEERKDTYIVEKYINNPLLINKKKFDLRLYVLVTSFHPLTIYLHSFGLVRRATENYDHKNFNNVFSHLTNYSINKKHHSNMFSGMKNEFNLENEFPEDTQRHPYAADTSYNKHTLFDGMEIKFNVDDDFDFDFDTPKIGGDGVDEDNNLFKSNICSDSPDEVDIPENNTEPGKDDSTDEYGLKMSFEEFNSWMRQNNIDNESVWSNIEDLLIKTLIVVEGKINTAIPSCSINPDSCFELFGFDVLLDEELHPWLMEVNFAPSLSTDSALDYEVKTQMLIDMLNLVGIRGPVNSVSQEPNEINGKGQDRLNLPNVVKSRVAANKKEILSPSPSSSDKVQKIQYEHFEFKGEFGGRQILFPTISRSIRSQRSLYYNSSIPLESDEENEKSYLIEDSLTELVSQFYKTHLRSSSERKYFQQFLNEKKRSLTTHFHCIFPNKSRFPHYSRYFLEERHLNIVLGRYEFFLEEYSFLIRQQHQRHRFHGKSQSLNSFVNTSSSTKFGSLNIEDLPSKINEDMWRQIHNRWSKAIGKSTAH